MSEAVIESFGYQNITGSTNVSASRSKLAGIFVATASSTPTLAVFDSATTGTTVTIIASFTPIAGTFYPIPALALSGVYVQIGGTVNCTVFVEKA